MTQYHFIRTSSNAKLGPIPATTTSADSCPPTCSFIKNGCYADSGPMHLHWQAVTNGKRGCTFEEKLGHIRKLPKRQLWRLNQAGDLTPSEPGVIDADKLAELTRANHGRRGFGFTHYLPTVHNRAALRTANLMGLTIAWSAETLAMADEYAGYACAPVVVTLPAGTTKPVRTPQGRLVTVCPASVGDMTCDRCGICAHADRKAIVGFPAHGSGAKRVERVFFQPQTNLLDKL